MDRAIVGFFVCRIDFGCCQMKLLSSPASPFGRKVKLAIGLKSLDKKVTIASVDATKGDPALTAANPMGRIPVLVLDSGQAIHDSHVICEYLDTVGTGPLLFPQQGPERWETLTLASLADGITEAALLTVYEGRYRAPEMKVQSWLDRLSGKISTSLNELERAPPLWKSSPDYGHLTLAAALGYLDFRLAGAWRAEHPKLVTWLDTFATTVPAFETSRPPA
jgi:glutathione S-transferase